MSKRYQLVNPGPGFRFGIGGIGGSSKSSFVLAPHPLLGVVPGSVEYAVADEGAELLEGIETDWLMTKNGQPRVKVVRPGWVVDKLSPLSWTKKMDGEAYGQAWRDWAQRPRPNVKTVIVDTVTTMAETYRTTVPCKDPRQAYMLAQNLCVEIYHLLWSKSPHLNILLLHHLAEILVESVNEKGKVELVKDTYTLATCGKALQQEWPKRFTGVFQLECRPSNKMDRSGAIGLTHDYFVRLKPHKGFKGLKIRSGITTHPAELKVTCVPGNIELILEGWDKIFELVDTARAARQAYIDAVSQ